MKKTFRAISNLESELDEACKLVCSHYNLSYENACITFDFRRGRFIIENVNDIANANEGLFNSISMRISNGKLCMRKCKKETELKITSIVSLTFSNSFDKSSIDLAVLTFDNGKWKIADL
jgi:hypothetical protein